VTKPLFYFNIMAKQSGRLMNTITLANQGFSSEVYEFDQRILGLHLEFSSESLENHSATFLMQNRPNPFRAETIIEFWLNESQNVGLKIYDPAGRVLKVRFLRRAKSCCAWSYREFSASIG